MERKKMKELPPGVTVKDEPCVGVNYMYEGRIIFQWLRDDDLGRKVIWDWYIGKRLKGDL